MLEGRTEHVMFLSKGTTQTVNFLSQILSDKHRPPDPNASFLSTWQVWCVRDDWVWEEKVIKIFLSFQYLWRRNYFLILSVSTFSLIVKYNDVNCGAYVSLFHQWKRSLFGVRILTAKYWEALHLWKIIITFSYVSIHRNFGKLYTSNTAIKDLYMLIWSILNYNEL